MKRIKSRLSYVLMAATVLLVALPAGAATASSPLILASEGVTVPTGSPASAEVGLAGCFVASEGTLTANSLPKDKLVSASNAFVECPEGTSISGVITEIQLSVKGSPAEGAMKLKGKIKLTKPGPCLYEFKKWSGKFVLPGFSAMEGTVEAKLKFQKGITGPECAPIDTEEFAAAAASASFSPLEAHL